MATDLADGDPAAGGLPRWGHATDQRGNGCFEATYIRPEGRRLHLVTGSAASLESAVRLLATLASAEAEPSEHSGDEVDLAAEVRRATQHLEDVLAGHDALDVMSLLVQFLVPPDLALWSEGGSTTADSWACAEVVALVLLGSGLPVRATTTVPRTASIIPDVVAAATEVVHLAEFASFAARADAAGRDGADDAVDDMAWRLRTHETTVRGRQYASIAERINVATLQRPNADAIWTRVLGFAYGDVMRVREALNDLVGAALQSALERVHAAATDGGPPDATVVAALRSMFETPSDLATVTADQVAAHTGLDRGVVTRVLDQFSLAPDGRSSLELVEEFIEGRNPMAGKGILKAADRGYLVLPGAIAPDEIRRTAEAPIAQDPAWVGYGKGRDRAAERLVADTFHALVQGRGEMHRQVHYRAAPRPGEDVDLSRTSDNADRAETAEADALLVLDGVALCIEVKAGSVRKPSRQGRAAHLRRDLKDIVGKAAGQADRLRSLVTRHHGLWLEDGTWLDLPVVAEVYSIVVSLDDLGPAALDLDALVRGGVLTQTTLPWIVSVHDAMVIAELLNRPEQFLTYLRRRTSRDAALWVTGVDELDIVMWFIGGGFFFEPDPDRLHLEHPGGRPPTQKERRTYAEQGRTIVGTFTDPLDAWYYHREGSSSAPAERSTRECDPFVRALIDQLTAVGAPGWWRVSADLDSYSMRAQASIADSVRGLLRLSASDGEFHTLSTGSIDDSGRCLFIFATGPDTPQTRNRLGQYLLAKKHQEHADRAMAFALGQTGQPCATLWLSGSWAPDPELDRLARAMGLVPPDRAPRVLPPGAKPGNARTSHKGRKRR